MRERLAPFAPLVGLFAVFAVVPGLFDSYITSLVSQYLLFVFIGCAWALLGGFGALVSLGHAAYFGLGGYSVAILVAQLGWHPLIGGVLGMALGAGLLWVFSWVSVRYAVSGIYFAGMTLLAAEALRALFIDLEFAGRSHGLSVYVDNFFGIPGLPATPNAMYFFMLLAAGLGIGMLVAIRRSRFGYELMALRDDEQAARCVGVRHINVKYLAASISGGLTALGGAMHAQLIGFVEPFQEFGLEVSLQLLFATFLGGRNSPYGPAVGMAVFFGGREIVVNLLPTGTLAAPALVQILFGLVLVIVVMLAPEGIMGMAAKQLRRWRQRRGLPPRALAVRMPEILPEGEATIRTEIEPFHVEGLGKRFGGLQALQDVDFSVQPGQVVGLIGPNGSGKSTFVNVVSGVYRPDGGEVAMGERSLTGLASETVSRAGLTRTFQVPRPFPNLTVLENLLVAALQVRPDMDQAVIQAYRAARSVGLEDEIHTVAKELQLAGLRRLELGRALAVSPNVLICDEAMSGLALGEQRELVALLHHLNETEGVSIVIIEHILPVVSELCEEVTVLDVGQRIAHGTPQEVLSNPVVVEAYIGKVEGSEPTDRT